MTPAKKLTAIINFHKALRAANAFDRTSIEMRSAKVANRAFRLDQKLRDAERALEIEDLDDAIMPVHAINDLERATGEDLDLRAWATEYRALARASKRRAAMPIGSTRARVTTANARLRTYAESWNRLWSTRPKMRAPVEAIVDLVEGPVVTSKAKPAPPAPPAPAFSLTPPSAPKRPARKAAPKRKATTPAPAMTIRDRTRRQLHQRAAKVTAPGAGPLAAVWHEPDSVLASNGAVTSTLRAESPSACERWSGRYSRGGKAEAKGYPVADVRARLFVEGVDEVVDLRALKRLAKVAKKQPERRPVGIIRKDGAIYAIGGQPLEDGEAIRQDKALGVVQLVAESGYRNAAVWVWADDLLLALATAGQTEGVVCIPDKHSHIGAHALRIVIPRLGEAHAVARIDAPAPSRVALKIGPPPSASKAKRPKPIEGQWAAVSCTGARVKVEHFDSQADAEAHLAAARGDWGYAARIDTTFGA